MTAVNSKLRIYCKYKDKLFLAYLGSYDTEKHKITKLNRKNIRFCKKGGGQNNYQIVLKGKICFSVSF